MTGVNIRFDQQTAIESSDTLDNTFSDLHEKGSDFLSIKSRSCMATRSMKRNQAVLHVFPVF
jgi:hypothetical protein